MSSSLIFLGTSGSCVTKKRACAGILLDDHMLLDAGYGVLSNFLKLGRNLDDIEEVYLSHTHSDHIGDFTGLIWTMAINGRIKPLRIIGSAKTCSSLKQILKLQSTPKEGFVKFRIKFSTPSKMKIPHLRTIHTPENLAYRFKVRNKVIVYTGDTALSKPVSEFSERADMLIHDGTYLTEKEALARLTKHSTAKQAGDIASYGNVKELILTHISPLAGEGSEREYLKQAKSSFGGDVSVAKDYQSFQI